MNDTNKSSENEVELAVAFRLQALPTMLSSFPGSPERGPNAHHPDCDIWESYNKEYTHPELIRMQLNQDATRIQEETPSMSREDALLKAANNLKEQTKYQLEVAETFANIPNY